MIRQRFKAVARAAIIFGLGLFAFSMIFLRTPSQYYQENGGRLVPIDPHQVAAMQGNPYNQHQPNQYYQPQQYNNQYSQPNRGGIYTTNQGGYTQVASSPYAPPPNQNFYNQQPVYRPPTYPNNSSENAYNPRGIQSNYSSSSNTGSAPRDVWFIVVNINR